MSTTSQPGSSLRTAGIRPARTTEDFPLPLGPTIVTITPYISDRYHPDALYFARNGFAT